MATWCNSWRLLRECHPGAVAQRHDRRRPGDPAVGDSAVRDPHQQAHLPARQHPARRVAAGALYPFTGWLLSPVLASAAMSLSSVSVLLNSLRLKRFERRSAN